MECESEQNADTEVFKSRVRRNPSFEIQNADFPAKNCHFSLALLGNYSIDKYVSGFA